MSADQIEARLNRDLDEVDEKFLADLISPDAYVAAFLAIHEWAAAQFRVVNLSALRA